MGYRVFFVVNKLAPKLYDWLARVTFAFHFILRLSQQPPNKTVIFVTFSLFEFSQCFRKHSPPQQETAMIVADLIGIFIQPKFFLEYSQKYVTKIATHGRQKSKQKTVFNSLKNSYFSYVVLTVQITFGNNM